VSGSRLSRSLVCLCLPFSRRRRRSQGLRLLSKLEISKHEQKVWRL
jgi:hypothetical protein